MPVYSLAFVGGFVIMSMELLGGRLLAPYFGSGIYVWGSIISVFMLALAVGYLMGGRLTLQQVNLRRFAGIFILSAVLLLPLTIANEPAMNWIFERILDPRLGSLLACLVLFFQHPVKIGDRVRVFDGDHWVEGELMDITYFFVFVRTEQEGVVSIPNAALLKNAFHIVDDGTGKG